MMKNVLSIDLFNDLLDTTTYSKDTHDDQKELSEIHDPSQKTKLNYLSEDELVNILNYLQFSDVLNFSVTSKELRKISKHNRVWRYLIEEKFENADNLRIELETVFEASSLKHEEDKQKQISKEQFQKKKKKYEKERKQLEHLLNFESEYGYYRAYKNLIFKKKQTILHKEGKVKEREDKRIRYRVLEKPQKIFEGIAVFTTPIFFLCLLITSLLYPLYLDQIIPNEIHWLILILLPFSFSTVILFAFILCIAFLADFLRSVRMGEQLETLSALFFLGNLWIPILPFLFGLKILILDEYSSWRAVLSPNWVVCFIFCFLTLFLPKRLKMKWGLSHKLLWGFNLAVNLAVCVTTGLLSAKFDNTLPSILGFSYFIFIPIWLMFFFSFIGIGIGFLFCLHQLGWRKAIFLYIPLTLNFAIPPFIFFIPMGLKLDGVISFIPWSVIFLPIYYFGFIWTVICVLFCLWFVCTNSKVAKKTK